MTDRRAYYPTPRLFEVKRHLEKELERNRRIRVVRELRDEGQSETRVRVDNDDVEPQGGGAST